MAKKSGIRLFKEFKEEAKTHARTSAELLAWQYFNINQAHYSSETQKASLAYPFYHAAKTIMSAGRVVKGALLMIKALTDDPVHNIPSVTMGIGLECIALVLNAINTIAACVLFVTRNLATLGGYTNSNSNSSQDREQIAAHKQGDTIISSIEERIDKLTTNL